MKGFLAMAAAVLLVVLPVSAYPVDDVEVNLDKQRSELNEKEELIKQETERLKALKKEVEEDIDKYTKLLGQIEKSLKEAEELGARRLRHISKAYEAMPPEDAASRLSGLDNDTAVQILLKMDSKKAGLVIGMMQTERATLLTREIARLNK
ncbi:MAG: hypothetical protein JSU90_04400 [Nitrospiraceae bacterium]|nr:MAG: hypothetical protein JSU90_04400 [Nitrospiraceae bacterium]